MIVQLAANYGFCFGVKRAIKIAEEHKMTVAEVKASVMEIMLKVKGT